MPCDNCEKLKGDLAMVGEEAEQVVVNHESHSAGVCQAGGVAGLASALSQTADNAAWLEGKLREAEAKGLDTARHQVVYQWHEPEYYPNPITAGQARTRWMFARWCMEKSAALRSTKGKRG